MNDIDVAKNELKKCSKGEGYISAVCLVVLNYIENLEKSIKEKQTHLENLQKVNEELEKRIAIMSEGGWHFSGTPEIPEDEIYSYVLVWTGDKTVFPLVYHRRCVRGKDVFRYEWLNGDKYGAGKIKAWQYVPKPPKAGEAEC